MNGNWLAVALGLGTVTALAVKISRNRQQHSDKHALKTEVRKWEDEGGNVPQVPTVGPVVAPPTSVPPQR